MTAPARFLRITPDTEITVPCVLARKRIGKPYIHGEVVNVDAEVKLLRSEYTHWLPVQFPEVRR